MKEIKADQPFVEVNPIKKKKVKVFGKLKGTVRFKGDIIAPILEKWEAVQSTIQNSD